MFGGAKEATEKFAAAVRQKTGLVPDGDRFVGTFQGLPAWTRTQMVADHAASARGKGGAFGGLLGLAGGAGGMAHAMTGGAFFMKYDYVVELTGSQLPGSSLRETTSFLVDKSWQQRPAIGGRVSSGVAWIDKKYEVCSTHPQFMPYVCAFPELQQALQRWPYLNLSWNGPEVWLELVDSTQRVHAKFGDGMSNGDMIAQGMWTVAAAARATFAR